ncbi:MAG: LLM class flavin-dependent oxidoreductase, partial [Geminicoccaceae bacterium]
RIRACWEPFRDARIRAGEGGAELGQGVGICTSLYVADTMESAAADVREAINGYYEFLCGSRPTGEWSRKMYLEDGAELDSEDRDLDWFDFLQKHRIIWVGTADYVTERIEEAKVAIGFDHLVALQQFPGVPYEKIRASWERLSGDVMPRFERRSREDEGS